MEGPTTFTTADGITLEGEWGGPSVPSAVVVLCHPHPQYGGTMRSIVISALFSGLPAFGYACLRFNFRGVENSEGSYDDGKSEVHDVVAALDAATAAHPGEPLVLVGWSFGADMALSITDARVGTWV